LLLDRKLHMALWWMSMRHARDGDTRECSGGTGRPDSGRIRSGNHCCQRQRNHLAGSGALPLHELEEVVGEPLQEEGITTASGWVTQRLGGFPKIGDTVALAGSEVRVEEMDGMRVASLTVRKRTRRKGRASSGKSAPRCSRTSGSRTTRAVFVLPSKSPPQ
jgi:hypothetical protein